MYSSKKLLTGRHSSKNKFYSVTICTKQRTPLFKSFENACIATRGLVYMQNKVNTICYTLMPEDDLINQARYIIANPLRAELVNKAEEYPFWDCVYLFDHESK